MITKGPIEEEYFNWLCAKVLEPHARVYHHLLEILYKTEFRWVIPADWNRAEEGTELREDFLRETYTKRNNNWMHEPCSIFEMILGFAKRASFQTDIPVRQWFWDILANLQLDQFRRISHSDIPIVETILDTFMDRTYDSHGYGGMFPITRTQNDQRDIEVWYQFCEYIDDRGLL